MPLAAASLAGTTPLRLRAPSAPTPCRRAAPHSDPFRPAHPAAEAVPPTPSLPPYIRRVASRRRPEDIYLQAAPRRRQPKLAHGLLIHSDRPRMAGQRPRPSRPSASATEEP
ncbi:hypothetical protein F0U64_27780 [Achromobacter xylosoxidans]|nr:hypothetical protein F0U64_27780 [Achromobacter xylosoxidans]